VKRMDNHEGTDRRDAGRCKDEALRSISMLEQALQERPEDPSLHCDLGHHCYALGDLENSRRHYEAARRHLDPGDGFAPALFRNYAICLGDLGDYEQALNLLDEGLSYFPDYPDLFFIKGQLYWDLNLMAQARANFLKCLRFRQSLYVNTDGVTGYFAFNNLAEVLVREQNLDEAAFYFEQALQCRSSYALFARLCSLLQQKGLPCREVAAHLEDRFGLDHPTIARLSFGMKQEQMLHLVLEAFAGEGYNLPLAAARAGYDPGEARQVLEQFALSVGCSHAALQDVESSLHSGAATATVHYLLGMACASLNKHDLAFLHFIQSGRLDGSPAAPRMYAQGQCAGGLPPGRAPEPASMPGSRLDAEGAASKGRLPPPHPAQHAPGTQEPANEFYAACALEQLASQCLLHITALLAIEDGQVELRRELFRLTSLRHKAQRLKQGLSSRNPPPPGTQCSSEQIAASGRRPAVSAKLEASAFGSGRPFAGVQHSYTQEAICTMKDDINSALSAGCPALSLCMIAKNESEHIGRCLQSAKDFVDEIIVVDTGSSDDTRDIARSFGAMVIESEWQDDFSIARNASLERATGDWILFLDCDEELAPGSGPKLRALIRDSRYEAYFIQVTNLTEVNSKLLAPSVRLFRNRNIFRFEGRIHEQIATSIIHHYGQQGIGQCSLSIIHHGYNGKQANIQAKIRRNLKLLNGVADEERNGFFHYNLGVEHLRLGEREKALHHFLEGSKQTSANLGYAPILALRTATTLMELSRFRDAVRHLKYYQGIYGDFKDLVLLEAICFLHCGWYSQANECLQRYFSMPPAPAWYPTETIYCGASAEEYRDWLQERLISRNHPEISICVIGRDEADHIRHCIRSVNEIAREVIYVDTGSTDNTQAIAFQHGARVLAIPWPGSFSEARKFALDRSAAEWVLMLDADEVLTEEGQRQIVDLVSNASPDEGGYILKICTFLDGSLSPVNCHLTGSCRLFRKIGACYRGAAGEEVVTSLLFSGRTVAPAEVAINHLHYQAKPDHIAQKRQWKKDCLSQELQEDTLAGNYLLGKELFYAQDFAAAAICFEACRSRSGMSNTPDFFYCYALTLINTGDYGCAAGILEDAWGLFPDYTDLAYLLAVAYTFLNKAGAAETLLRRCLELGDAPWQKYLTSPGAGSFRAMQSLGTILAQRGLVQEAADLLFQAAALPGGFEQAIEGIVILSDKLGVPLEELLENRGLLNSASLAAASGTCAKMLRFQDSLHYLAKACDQVARDTPRNFTNITRVIDLLVKMFCRGA